MIDFIIGTPRRVVVALAVALLVGAGVCAALVGVVHQPQHSADEATYPEQARVILSTIDQACREHLTGDTEYVREVVEQYSKSQIDVLGGGQPVSQEVKDQAAVLSRATAACREYRLGQGLSAVVGSSYTWNEACLNERGASLNDRGQVQLANGQKLAELSGCATVTPTAEQCKRLYSALSADSAPIAAALGGLPVGTKRIYEQVGCTSGR